MGRCLKTRKRFFTLIEVIIVMVLVLIAAGLGGYSLTRALNTQRFETEAEAFVGRLNRLSELLMLLNIESEVRIEKGEVREVPVGTLSDAYLKMLQRDTQTFKAIHSVAFEPFDGENSFTDAKGGKVTLSFLDRGFRLPYGLLILESERGETRFVWFKGYPAPLKLLKEKPDWQREEGERKAFNERLTQSTWREKDV